MPRSEPYTVNETKALLLAQEEHLDKHSLLNPLASPVATVVASWNPVHSRTHKSKNMFNNFCGNRGSSRLGFFMGLILPTTDLTNMTHGIILQPHHDPLVKSARNPGILLSSAGNSMINTLPLRLTQISLNCKTLSPRSIPTLTTLCGTHTVVPHTISRTTPLLSLTRILMTTLTQ